MEKLRVDLRGERYDFIECVYSPSGVLAVLVNGDGLVKTAPISDIVVIRRKSRADNE